MTIKKLVGLSAADLKQGDRILSIGVLVNNGGETNLVVDGVPFYNPDGYRVRFTWGGCLTIPSNWKIDVEREQVKNTRYFFRNSPSVLERHLPSSQLWQNASLIVDEVTGKILKNSIGNDW